MFRAPDSSTSGRSAQGSRIYGGGAKAAWFKDSEGNVMAIIQNDAV